MNKVQKVLPWSIDVSQMENDPTLIHEFDWQENDCCLIFREDEWGDRYWDLFEYFDWSSTSTENSDLLNVKNKSLYEILEDEPSSIVRWLPLRFKFQ